MTEIAGSMVATDWSVEENVIPGTGDTDTLTIAMSTSALYALSGAGDLIYLVLETSDIRHPASTALEIVHLLFNEGNPVALTDDGSLKLLGTDGTVETAPDSIYPRLPITITVDDIDEDRETGLAEDIEVLAFDVVYDDSQIVTLGETDVSTGIFTGTVSTEFEPTGGASWDGVIGTTAGDTVFVSYVDSLSATGTTEERTAFTEVIGGVDGVLDVTYVVQSLDQTQGHPVIRDTVRARVTDANLNFSDIAVDTAGVRLVAYAIVDTERVRLPETDLDTGVFRERVPTEEGATGTTDDGFLKIATSGVVLDSIDAVYFDTLTALGGTDSIWAKTYVVNLFGDVSGNNRVGAFDGAEVLGMAVGLGSPSFRDSLAADVSGDNDVKAWDGSLVLQYVVRLIDRFPVQTDTSITGPGDIRIHPFLKAVPVDRLIALGEMRPQPDGTHLMPVVLTERRDILSGTLEIGHGRNVEITGVTTGDGYGKFMLAHNALDDRIRIAFAGSSTDAQGPGEVLWVRFRTTGDAPLRFSIDQVTLNGHRLTSVQPEILQVDAPAVTPRQYALHQNVPNPFNPATSIRYDLPEAAHVTIAVYNLLGQQVRTLVMSHQEEGSYQVAWDGKDTKGREAGSGVYFAKRNAGGFTQLMKMLLLR